MRAARVSATSVSATSVLLMFPLLTSLFVAGCEGSGSESRRRLRSPTAKATPPVEAQPTRDAPMEADRSAAFQDELAAPLSRTMLMRGFETISIAPPTKAAEPRPRQRGGRVDIELNGAPFVDTVRMLAEVGRFDVVVEAPSAGGVQASLHGVDAWDALVAICDAKGVDVRYERGVALVGGAPRQSAP